VLINKKENIFGRSTGGILLLVCLIFAFWTLRLAASMIPIIFSNLPEMTVSVYSAMEGRRCIHF
jgi:hypothetical protein